MRKRRLGTHGFLQELLQRVDPGAIPSLSFDDDAESGRRGGKKNVALNNRNVVLIGSPVPFQG